ncbi:AbrB/MazE/SpoVT family DNA-binding domain-containing protein [Roseixanthobacter liquoris]|uniref:AbrB/MazE/SpoVT family DNA-binding domain-containing protein n=1 Tax=Roseixanthobacter liquoris TaxID=3119921 RepID=UPI003726E7FC
MITTIAKWGNSMALRLPAAFVREIAVREGTSVDISIVDGALVVRPVEPMPTYDLDTLLRQISDDNRHDEVLASPSVGNEF